MHYSKFDETNIPAILDVVAPDWSPPQADMDFRRLYAEYIVRHNIYSAKYSLQSTDDDGEFTAAVFAEIKGSGAPHKQKKLNDWLLQRTDGGKSLSEEQKTAFSMSESYLNMMDEKTFFYMNDDDIKLSLFVSCRKGAGFPLLEKFKAQLKEQGYKKLYLWTDFECNYEWYFEHGYELVEKYVYEPFSSSEPYETFIFRKTL